MYLKLKHFRALTQLDIWGTMMRRGNGTELESYKVTNALLIKGLKPGSIEFRGQCHEANGIAIRYLYLSGNN